METDGIHLLPPREWSAGCLLRRSAWRAAAHHGEPAYRTLSTPGAVSLRDGDPGWSFHTGVDGGDYGYQFWMIANGWVAGHAKESQPRCMAFWSASRAITGFARSPFKPGLFSAEHPVQQGNDLEWLDLPDHHVALLRVPEEKGVRFALAVSHTDHADAVRLARLALRVDPFSVSAKEYAARQRYWTRNASAGPLLKKAHTWALETVVGALRPAEGALPHTWSESETQPGTFDINRVLPLCMAWGVIDPAVAEDIVRTALSRQQPNGFIPAWARTDGQQAKTEMAWPSLASAVQVVLEHGGEPDFATYALPRLIKFIDHALRRFARQGHFAWTGKAEAFVPDVFEADTSTVDCAAMLLTEIDTVRKLAAKYPVRGVDLEFIEAERETVFHHLTSRLWDSEEGAFRDRVLSGPFVSRKTIGRFLALGVADIPAPKRSATARRLGRDKDWRNDLGLAQWEPESSKADPPPVSALAQAYLLRATQLGDPQGKAIWYAEALKGCLLRQFKTDGRIASESAPSSVDAALLWVTATHPHLQDGSGTLRKNPGRLTLWLDRHRTPVLLITSALVLITLLSIVLTYMFRTNPTGTDIEVLSSIAERHYHDGRYEEAIAIYQDLSRHLPGNVTLHQRLANALYRAGRLEEAETHYRRALAVDYPPPAVLRNLAITLFYLERYEESAEFLEELIERYGTRYVRLAEDAQVLLDIIETRQQEAQQQ